MINLFGCVCLHRKGLTMLRTVAKYSMSSITCHVGFLDEILVCMHQEGYDIDTDSFIHPNSLLQFPFTVLYTCIINC